MHNRKKFKTVYIEFLNIGLQKKNQYINNQKKT